SKLILISIIIFVSTIFIIFLGQKNLPQYDCSNCNVIIISIHSLRADHVGIDGYERNTTPNIDRFFRNGYVFRNAFAQAPLTLPSDMTMLTGLYPSHHGLISVEVAETLSPKYKTLAEILKAYDYTTVGFHGGADGTSPQFGFDRGFDEYVIYDFVGNDSKLIGFLKSSENQKFFLFLDTSGRGVHDPYLSIPPYETMFDNNYHGKIISDLDEFQKLMKENNISYDDFDSRRTFYWSFVNKSDSRDIQHLIALYDANIFRYDEFFGKFFDYLNSSGLLNRTIIIFTTDHGEEFGEHGGFMHSRLYDETIRVPLLVFLPNSKNGMIHEQVGLVDIVPTVLSFLNITQPAEIDGRNLNFLIENPNNVDTNATLFSEFLFTRAVRTPEWKLIKNFERNITYEFYNIKNDSSEKVNLVGKGIPEEAELKNLMKNYEIRMNSTYFNPQLINSTFIGYP
ncbi:MAG TPA: sulfatase, partial [Nitrososphaerales archaeon]